MNLPKSKYLLVGISVVGFLGFLDAAYLTILHYKQTIPPCTVTNGCETVLTSSYSEIFGIPIALFGAGFYLTVIALTILLLTNPKQIFLKFLYAMADIGFLVSAVLIYIQFAILKTSCQYCLFSEVISFLIFLGAIQLWRNLRQK